MAGQVEQVSGRYSARVVLWGFEKGACLYSNKQVSLCMGMVSSDL